MGIVKEKLDFERGMDPKKSMGLGYANIHTYEDMLRVFPEAIEEESFWNTGALWDLNNGLKAFVKYQIIKKTKTGITYSSDFDVHEVLQVHPFKIVWRRIVSEAVNFERGIDPKSAMGLGKMKKIQDWMGEINIKRRNYKVNPDYSIFTDMDVILIEREDLIINGRFPEYIRFHTSGSFDIDRCRLVSLEGCPKYVQGYFSCQQNEISSLEGFPEKIDKSCYVMGNEVYFTADQISDICEVGGQIEADDSDV